MFTLAISYLTISNLPLIHGLNIPGYYAILFFTASEFIFTTGHIHKWVSFPLWLRFFILSGAISLLLSSSISSVQFISVAQSCLTLGNPMNRSTPGLPVHHQLLEFTQTHVHWVHDAIQPSHPLSSPSPPAPNPSQHQSLFQWVNSSHEVAKVLEFQL